MMMNRPYPTDKRRHIVGRVWVYIKEHSNSISSYIRFFFFFLNITAAAPSLFAAVLQVSKSDLKDTDDVQTLAQASIHLNIQGNHSLKETVVC